MPTDNGENIKKFRDNADFTYLEQSERGETFYILLHVGQEGSPLQDQRVRCGLAAAIQQDVIAEVIGQGSSRSPTGRSRPASRATSRTPATRSPTRPRPRSSSRPTPPSTASRRSSTRRPPTPPPCGTAQLIQQWWQDAGVTVEVNQIEQQKLILDALLGDPGFNAFGWRNHAGPRRRQPVRLVALVAALPARSAGAELRPHAATRSSTGRSTRPAASPTRPSRRSRPRSSTGSSPRSAG